MDGEAHPRFEGVQMKQGPEVSTADLPFILSADTLMFPGFAVHAELPGMIQTLIRRQFGGEGTRRAGLAAFVSPKVTVERRLGIRINSTVAL